MGRVMLSDDGKVLYDYLMRARADVKEKLVAAEADTMVRRLQGRAEAVKDLAEALETAPDLIVKLENRANGR